MGCIIKLINFLIVFLKLLLALISFLAQIASRTKNPLGTFKYIDILTPFLYFVKIWNVQPMHRKWPWLMANTEPQKGTFGSVEQPPKKEKKYTPRSGS